jgi:hypothetical protein
MRVPFHRLDLRRGIGAQCVQPLATETGRLRAAFSFPTSPGRRRSRVGPKDLDQGGVLLSHRRVARPDALLLRLGGLHPEPVGQFVASLGSQVRGAGGEVKGHFRTIPTKILIQ